jgi:hypothetical protein
VTRKRVDANQPEIVAALRGVGATVEHLHAVGCGCPDILVGFRGRNYLLEIKAGQANLNLRELEWHSAWRGDVKIVHTPDEALYEINAMG